MKAKSKMSDLLLINPEIERGRKTSSLSPPMGTLSIGSYVAERGYNVKLIDCQIYKNSMTEIFKYIKDTKIIGFSVMTAQIEHAFIISKEIKKYYPDKIIVWGGVHPSLFSKETLKCPFIDYVIVGEGEKAMLKLLKNPNLKEKIIKEKMLTTNEIPKLNYNLIPVDKYLISKFDGKLHRKLVYPTSRGCLFRCTFCINVIIWKRNYRILSSERVLDELEEFIKEYKLTLIWFGDEDMFGNKERIRKILQGIIDKKLNIIWRANLRVSYFRKNYINGDFLELMIKSGAKELAHGVESGSERIRKLLKKDITEEQVLKSAELYNKYDVTPVYSFMCAIPTETKEEFLQTLDLIDRIKRICPKAVILGPQPYRPYPGGELYDLALSLGFKSPSTINEWIKETDLFTSSVSTKKFPWVDKKMISLYENVGKYVTIGTQKFSKIWNLSKLMILPWIISKFRWKFRFFRFPIDWKIYKMVNKIIPFY